MRGCYDIIELAHRLYYHDLLEESTQPNITTMQTMKKNLENVKSNVW